MMMNYQHTGGPAFPFEYVNQTSRHQKSFVSDDMIAPHGAEQYAGMTIRDYFAAKAMVGATIRGWPAGVSTGSVAKQCYELADAMLRAREAT